MRKVQVMMMKNVVAVDEASVDELSVLNSSALIGMAGLYSEEAARKLVDVVRAANEGVSKDMKIWLSPSDGSLLPPCVSFHVTWDLGGAPGEEVLAFDVAFSGETVNSLSPSMSVFFPFGDPYRKSLSAWLRSVFDEDGVVDEIALSWVDLIVEQAEMFHYNLLVLRRWMAVDLVPHSDFM